MIWIILPAYNEEQALPGLFESIDRELRAAGLVYTVVVVNDGSRDETSAVLARAAGRYPLEVVTHRINRGLWETIRDGFEFVAAHAVPTDIIVRMDADATHDPAVVPRMVARMNEGFDVVITSRYQRGGGQTGLSLFRRFISRCANLFLKTLFPVRGVWDYSCGFRAYRAEVIQKALEIYRNEFISLKGVGFTCTIEKLLRLREMGARFTAVPFVLRYDQKAGGSKMAPFLTTIGYFLLAAKVLYPWNPAAKEWRRKGREWREGRKEASECRQPPAE